LISITRIAPSDGRQNSSTLNAPWSKPTARIASIATCARRACTSSGRRLGYSKRRNAVVPGCITESTTPNRLGRAALEPAVDVDLHAVEHALRQHRLGGHLEFRPLAQQVAERAHEAADDVTLPALERQVAVELVDRVDAAREHRVRGLDRLDEARERHRHVAVAHARVREGLRQHAERRRNARAGLVEPAARVVLVLASAIARGCAPGSPARRATSDAISAPYCSCVDTTPTMPRLRTRRAMRSTKRDESNHRIAAFSGNRNRSKPS
jgi:hypothetical protein